MQNKFLIGFIACFVALAAFSFRSEFNRGTAPYVYKEVTGTIATADLSDTVSLQSTLSDYQMGIQILRTNVSGTTNVKVYLEETMDDNSTAMWKPIDSVSTTTATVGEIRRDHAYGRRYRVRIKGTGTQNTTYSLSTILKQNN